MTPGPMVLRGPMNLNGIEKWKSHQSHMWTAKCRPENPLKFWRRPFFFWRSLDFGQKNRWNFGEDLFFLFTFFGQKNRWNFGEDLFFCFLEITSFFEPNYSIFSVYFGLYKTTLPSHLSCPRAHVWLSAPLNEIKGLQNLKLFDCMRSNTFCTPSTACNQNFSKVGDWVSDIIILNAFIMIHWSTHHLLIWL